MDEREVWEVELRLYLAVAPYTLLFACGDSAPILCLLVCVKVSDAARGEISLRCWSASGGSIRAVLLATEPVARSWGVSIVQSDNYTGPSLHLIKRNFPQSNVAWPKKRCVVTVTVLVSLYEGKKYHSCTQRNVHPPVCSTNSSSHCCPKNSVCPR